MEKPKKLMSALNELIGMFAVAIVVMILLVVFVFPMFYGSSKDRKRAGEELEAIGAALGQYRSERGEWPGSTNSSVSKALVQKSPAGKPWLTHESRDNQGRLLDPWDHPYQFFLSNDGYIVRSAGPDGKFAKGSKNEKNDDFYQIGG